MRKDISDGPHFMDDMVFQREIIQSGFVTRTGSMVSEKPGSLLYREVRCYYTMVPTSYGCLSCGTIATGMAYHGLGR